MKTVSIALMVMLLPFCLMASGGAGTPVATDDIVCALKDDDVLLKIGDHDVLKWGTFRRHLNALDEDVKHPNLQTAIKSAAYKARFRKLLRDYVQYGVIAEAARKAGITIPAEEFERYRAMARKQYANMGEVGKRLSKLMDGPNSFYEQNLTNALLWLEYREKIIKPKVRVTDESIRNLIENRRQRNIRCMATNEVKRVFIHEILKKVRGGMDFAEAAKQWSDCESADAGGVLMDDVDDTKPARFEPGDNHPAIEKVCADLKEGEISEVAETPLAWHILKVMKRHPATDDAEASVELAHIMLEKEMLKPEYDEASARKTIYDRTLRSGTQAEFLELYKQTKIESKVPLMDGETPTAKTLIKGGKK